MTLGKVIFSTLKIPKSLHKECFSLWQEYGTIDKGFAEFTRRYPNIKVSSRTFARAAQVWVLENMDEAYEYFKARGDFWYRKDFEFWCAQKALTYYPGLMGFKRAADFLLLSHLEDLAPQLENIKPGFLQFFNKRLEMLNAKKAE